MDDIHEISSDSNDTILVPQNSSFAGHLSPTNSPTKSTDNDDIQEILKKYSSQGPSATSSSNNLFNLNLENSNFSEDDELITAAEPLSKRLRRLETVSPSSSSSSNSSMEKELRNLQQFSEKYKEKESLLSGNIILDENNILKELSEKYKVSPEENCYVPTEAIHKNTVKDTAEPEKSKKTKEDQKLEKQLEKERKLQEKRQKKEEQDREKAIKQALATANKNIKPTECMKFVKIHIDGTLLEEKFGNNILSAIQQADVKYEAKSQIFPNTITWSRQLQSQLMNDGGKLTLSSENCDTDEILVIMCLKDFLQHVGNNTLCTHFQSIKSILAKKRHFLIVHGLKQYFKHHKNQQNRDFRAAIMTEDEDTNDKGSKSNRKSAATGSYKNLPEISRGQIDVALTELQLLHSVSHCMADTGPDLGQMIVQYTKAVAQLPYKQDKHKKQLQTDWYVSGDNRDCVRVDQNGNGLRRLWNQVLTTFPMARLETADAITTNYETPSKLMEAYENCPVQGEKLLQDIPVRRAAGPLTSVRKIGPEFSKKVHTFFTSLDGDALL